MNKESRIMKYGLSGGLLVVLLVLGFWLFPVDSALAQVSVCSPGQIACPQGCELGRNCESCWTRPTCTIDGQIAAICGSCQCPSGQIVCGSACQVSQAGQACTTADGRPGTRSACGQCSATERPPVRLSPYGVETDDQGRPSVWINKTGAGNLIQLQSSGNDRLVLESDGDLRVLGAAAGGDIYLSNGKAIRIDGTGTTELNFGNWGAGADGLAVNFLGTLTVGSTTFQRDLTVHGNITLPRDGATVDGVNLDNVILTSNSYENPAWLTSLGWNKLTSFPAACRPGQFVTALGYTLTCASPPASGVTGSGTATNIAFWSGSSALSSSSNLYWDNIKKRLGIGTNNPVSDLHVSGGTGSVELRLEADTNNSGGSNQPRLTLTQDGGTVRGQLGYFNSSNDLTLKNVYNSSLILGTNDTDQVAITNIGQVGIGTTRPSATLDVVGNLKVGGNEVVNSRGRLRFNQLEYNDFDWALRGSLLFGASSGYDCSSICSNHGLACGRVFTPGGTERTPSANAPYPCGRTDGDRVCWCN